MLFCKYYIDVALRLQKPTLMQTWGVLYVGIIVKVCVLLFQTLESCKSFTTPTREKVGLLETPAQLLKDYRAAATDINPLTRRKLVYSFAAIMYIE